MSDTERDKELFDIPPGMREPTKKAPGENKPGKVGTQSKAALIFFVTLLILAFSTITYSLYFAWHHFTQDGNRFSITKPRRERISTTKPHIEEPANKRDYEVEDRYKRKITENPENSDNIYVLMVDLKSGNKTVRRKAMFALGKTGNPKGIPPVVGILRTKDTDERVDAVRALGEFKHHLAVEPLIETLNSKNKRVRERAIYTLSESHDLRALNALIEVLSSEDFPSRASAADGLGHFKHPLAIEALIEALSDEDEEVRRHAIFALAKIGDSRIIEQLNKIQDETTDKRLKHDIMVVLNQIDDNDTSFSIYWKPTDFSPKDTDALIAALKNTYDSDRTLFLETVEALGETGDIRAEKALLNMLEKYDHHQTVNKIIRAISNIGSPYSIPPLIKKLDDPEELVVDRADLALRLITGHSSKKKEGWNEWWRLNKKGITKYNSNDMMASFIIALDDPNPTVKKYAVGFLGRMKDTRVVEPLIKLFYSENCDKDMRREVIKALARIKDPRTIDTLIASLDMDNGYSNFIAVRALGEFKDPAAVEPLIKVLRESSKTMSVERTLYALGRLGDPRAMDAILEKLESPDPRIRKDAARALGGAGDMSAMPHLKKALDDDDKYVRERAAKAILAIDGRYFYEKGDDKKQGEE